MHSKRQFLLFPLLILAVAAISGGYLYRQTAPTQPSDELADHPVVSRFVKALQLIEEHYAATPDRERLTRGAVNGMLHTLDPHSSFFPKRDFAEMQDEQSSKFYGIGVTINQRSGRIYVLGVSPGMPAERAGLRYGDALLEVDGVATKDWSQADALKYVRGNRGSTVEITVNRIGEAEPVKMRIVRDEVPFPSVRNKFLLRPGLGYIALTGGFNQATSEELRAALDDLKESGMTSLVLDLRRNPGGLLRQAIQVAETFLPTETEIVSVRGRTGRLAKQIYRSDNPKPETMPLVVLIDHETASASEIVAGAIQDRDRGWIVGEESFGKGLVQTVFRLPGGTGLTLTTAKYYTASGRSIQRAYNGVSLYDYYAARRTRTAPPAERDKEAFYTPTRRELHSGGGITPDSLVRTPQENVQLRDACFEFARRLVAGALPGLSNYRIAKTTPGQALRENEYPVTEQVLAALRLFLREQPEYFFNEKLLSENADYLRRRLRAEIITAVSGIEAAEQFLMESDAQALRAIEEMPKARLLTERARLFPPTP